MPFDWSEFRKVADYVCSGLEDTGFCQEAGERTAVSRIYYGIFNRLLRYASINMGYRSYGDGRDHGALIDHLKLNRKQVEGNKLGALLDMRAYCDYDDGEIEEKDTTTMLRDSYKLANRLTQKFNL